ncbi:MAG TPA: hypothetical protein VEV43_02250 [Actinomycetota bacterium]|nr:hypothetical protein [Actinomycetota bacterium]
MKKLRSAWQSLWVDVDRRVHVGRILGLVFVTAGFVVIGKAWDGAASINFTTGQFPYLLSGGFMGLGLIVTGCTLLLLATVRGEREVMSQKFDEVAKLLSRSLTRMQSPSNGVAGSGEQVVAGETTYHRADCKILQGKTGLSTLTVEQATAEGLTACRVCDPPQLAAKAEEKAEEKSTANGDGAAPAEEPAEETSASS